MSAGQPLLTGDVLARFWVGTAQQSEPQPCGVTRFDREVFMPATGVATGLQVAFGGTSWRPHRNHCGPAGWSYNPDHFTGTIEPAIQEFQSVNNDGGEAVNEPTVFRRIRCSEPPAISTVPTAPIPPHTA